MMILFGKIGEWSLGTAHLVHMIIEHVTLISLSRPGRIHKNKSNRHIFGYMRILCIRNFLL